MKKKRLLIGAVVLVLLAACAVGGYLYFTRPEGRFTDTRISKKDQGPQYVKYVVKDHTTLTVAANAASGDSITTEIKQDQPLVETTAQIDAQIEAELDKGTYTFEEPLVIQDPYQNSPLSALVVYNGKGEGEIRITVKGKDADTEYVNTLKVSDRRKIPVIGLYADTENEVLLEELDSSGKASASQTLNIQTETLPEALQNIVQVDQKTEDSAISLMVVTGGAAPYVYGFDANGDVRWYLTNKTGATFGGYPLSNGHFLIESEHTLMPTALKPHASQFHDIDYLGRVYQDYFFTSGVHHELKEKTPDGNLLVVTDSGEGYGQDMIQEYDRATGELVKELDLKDVFKDSGYVNKTDWAHINTFSYDPKDDAVIINPRNLHSGIKLNWSTNEVQWILGDPEFWKGTGFEDKVLTPKGDIEWFYQPHTVYEVEMKADEGKDQVHVMLFDNHNDASRKVKSFQETGESYVRSYVVNQKDFTVEQEHVYPCAYSSITSNYALDDTQKRIFSSSAYVEGEERKSGEITEFDYDSEKLLNRYKVRHNYYRAYLRTIDPASCLGEVDTKANYLKGELRTPAVLDKSQGKPYKSLSKSAKKKVYTSMLGNILMFTAPDHSFTQVVFAGDKNSYVYDISDIKKRSKVSFDYAVPIPLSGLEKDTYQIYVMYKDDYYKLDQSFTIG